MAASQYYFMRNRFEYLNERCGSANLEFSHQDSKVWRVLCQKMFSYWAGRERRWANMAGGCATFRLMSLEPSLREPQSWPVESLQRRLITRSSGMLCKHRGMLFTALATSR